MQLSMFIVILIALVIPIVMARFKLSNVPTAVAEIVTGILLGSSALNIVHQTSQLTFLSDLGVILLMFLSGMEINFDLFKRDKQAEKRVSPLKIAIIAFAGVSAMSLVLALILRMTGMFSDLMLAVILFMTVALGVVIATLKEKDILHRPVGQTILLTAVLGEVVPLLLLTIYASINGGSAGKLWLIVLLFLAAIALLYRFKKPYEWFNKVTKATTQIDIRLAFFLIFSLVTVAEQVGAENILGAFLAGMVMKLLQPSKATKEKLTSIGYGFFIPIFFIMTGVKLDLKTILANPQALTLLPVLVLFFLLAKLPVALVYLRSFSTNNAFAGGFLTATTITIVLPTLQVARELKAINSVQSGEFILAALVVCIISPIIFNSKFELSREDKIKKRVVIVGANALTLPAAQELHDNWYFVRVLTSSQDHFDTYKSRLPNLEQIPGTLKDDLLAARAFDCDIFVASYLDDAANLLMGQLAKEAGVKRVIVSALQPDLAYVKQAHAAGIEVFNEVSIRSAMLRALIESPSVYQIALDTKNVLYEVQVENEAYAGRELRDWEFIDDMTISRIRRNGQWLYPHGSTVIELGDRIIFSGKLAEADKIKRALQAN